LNLQRVTKNKLAFLQKAENICDDMPNCVVDLQKVAGLPTPLAVPCFRFGQETHPVVKLQRLIDCFEVIIKYSAY
jgi:hypothetical protein